MEPICPPRALRRPVQSGAQAEGGCLGARAAQGTQNCLGPGVRSDRAASVPCQWPGGGAAHANALFANGGDFVHGADMPP
jgi:hypothetical protein